jgi:glycerol kinase
MSFVLAIDQGTTSTRAIVFDERGQAVGTGQLEHAQIFPQPGWVEHDPKEILANTDEVIRRALADAGIDAGSLAAVGITNQRETTVIWDRATGEAIHNAIVWQDTRTQPLVDALADGDPLRFQARTGLSLATYFAGPKASWILDEVPGARQRAEAGELCFGTIDTWLLWHLTGGTEHATDVTNAARTLLMDINTLRWDADMCERIGVPMGMLPKVLPSSARFGVGASDSVVPGVPITGMLGDQHAATLGQACFTPGAAKNTYGTGCFLLLVTGDRPVLSQHGLLTTVAYQLGDAPAVYALEGSVAVAGSLVQWLRDNLGIVSSSAEIEELAASVPDNGGAYLVPAFSGLFAPHWRPDARGVLAGLTRYVTKAHIARAALEATAFQTREVVEAMNADVAAAGLGEPLSELKVDGGMTANNLLMQVQADQLGVPVIRPEVTETTALGAAYAAGLAVGYWEGAEAIATNWREDARWLPRVDAEARDRDFAQWKKAVARTLDWVE